MKLSMIVSQLSTGMAGTISIFVLTLVFSLPLGLLIAFGQPLFKDGIKRITNGYDAGPRL